jgi:ankyrin repeat protein
MFSCQNKAQGHLDLALICVHYLLSWLDQPVSQEELDAAEGNHILALRMKSAFLVYATKFWLSHVRETSELILPFVPLVSKLLQSEKPKYKLMLQIRSLDDESVDFWDFKYESPPHLLASYNLVHVLKALRLKKNPARNLKSKRRNSFSLFRATKKPVSSADVLEFGVDDRDYYQSTPLHDAAQNGAKETVEFLLEHGADGSLLDKAEYTPFYHAVAGGHADIARSLISHKQYYPDKPLGKSTSLHWACYRGMDDIVQLLLSRGADPNANGPANWTPVHMAARAGHNGILRQLLNAGGEPTRRTTNGHTPLHLAAVKGSFESVKVLIQFKRDLDLLSVDEDGCTPLYHTAKHGHIELFHWLRSRAPLVKPAKDGRLPIHVAAQNGHLAIVESLVDHDNILVTDNNEYSPLHYAVIGGHLSIVRMFVEVGLKYGLNIDTAARDLSLLREVEPSYCITALTLAVNRGFLEICSYLLEKGANKSVLTSRNSTLIHFAGLSGHVGIFDLLVQKGLDPCGKDIGGIQASIWPPALVPLRLSIGIYKWLTQIVLTLMC